MKEVFKEVKGYDGGYLVSSQGYVLSLKNKGEHRITTFKHKTGYLTVSLSKNGKIKTHSLHSIVAEAFLVKPVSAERIVVDHIDNDKLNNCLENLQYITNRQNSTKDKEGYTSPHPGVKISNWKKNGKFTAVIRIAGEQIHLKNSTELDCKEAYEKALSKYLSDINYFRENIQNQSPKIKRDYLLT